MTSSSPELGAGPDADSAAGLEPGSAPGTQADGAATGLAAGSEADGSEVGLAAGSEVDTADGSDADADAGPEANLEAGLATDPETVADPDGMATLATPPQGMAVLSVGAVDSGSAREFREQARQWLAGAPRPPGLRDYGATPTPVDVPAGRAWQRALAEAGYACLHWPARWGGREAGVAEQAAFAEEAAWAGVPRQLNIVGPDLVGPVLMAFGTPDQCERHLERIRTGEEMWCQLFSEPDAGSDLAAVRTRAVPVAAPDDGDGDGDDGGGDGAGGWVVNGQKVWTSGGGGAEYGLLLARTGGPGHGGLSVFLVPMAAEGVVARPLRQMDGESKFNEVFLSGLELAPDSLVGEVGQGWRIATATLSRERLSLGANAVGMFRALDDLAAAARQRGRLDEHLRDRVTELWIRAWLLRTTWERAIHEGAEPEAPSFSVLKLLTAETHRAIGDLGVEALGPDAVWSEDDEPLVHRMLVGHAQTILGGTSEIQRNILAERVLGLPREPSR